MIGEQKVSRPKASTPSVNFLGCSHGQVFPRSRSTRRCTAMRARETALPSRARQNIRAKLSVYGCAPSRPSGGLGINGKRESTLLKRSKRLFGPMPACSSYPCGMLVSGVMPGRDYHIGSVLSRPIRWRTIRGSEGHPGHGALDASLSRRGALPRLSATMVRCLMYRDMDQKMRWQRPGEYAQRVPEPLWRSVLLSDSSRRWGLCLNIMPPITKP